MKHKEMFKTFMHIAQCLFISMHIKDVDDFYFKRKNKKVLHNKV